MPPYVLIWSGWGLGTLAIAVFSYFVGPMLGIGLGHRYTVPLLLAGLLNFGFVRMLENMNVEHNGRWITRGQESTLFFMPLHYWTYIFLVLGVGLFAGGLLGFFR